MQSCNESVPALVHYTTLMSSRMKTLTDFPLKVLK